VDINLLNVKITIQKNSTIVDEIGNHNNDWLDYYTCYATVNGEGGKEISVAGIIADDSDISFSIRYCTKSSVVNNTEYRVLFQENVYNILSVDHMNFKRKSLKLKCQKARR